MTIKEAGDKVNISMTRGDSESITVRCSVPFKTGDRVYFTVREDPESEIALQKVIDDFPGSEAVIGICPQDTEPLDFGTYVYDIQVTRADGTVTTLVKPSGFKLDEEGTY